MNLSKDIVNFTKESDSKIESGNTLGVLFGKVKHYMESGSTVPIGGTTGQFLRVDSNGKPAWETVPEAEDSSF